jgi:O-antigen/teichoic acid export membrane protein
MDQRLVLVAAAAGIVLLHFHGYQLAFQLRQAYRPITTLALGGQLGFLAACAVAVGLQAAGTVFALLVVVREAVQALGLRLAGRRAIGAPLEVPFRHPGAGILLRAGWMIGAGAVAYKLCAHAGGFILWEVASPEALGSFNAAQRLLLPLSDMAWLLALPLLAAFSRSATRDRAAFRLQLEGHLKLMLAMAASVAVAAHFVGPFVLRLLYGDIYATGPWSAVEPLRWIALAYLFALVAPVLVMGEIAQGGARALLGSALASLAANVALNAWLAPKLGAEGAAIALCGSEALFLSLLLARCVLRGDARPGLAWVPYLAPAALLGVVLWLLRDSPAGQLASALALAPASLVALTQLPAQRACRRSLSRTAPPATEPPEAARGIS